MKGRATRRCDDIGKTVFKIYDPVDLYQALEPVDTMKPLVKDPSISVEQLVQELNNHLHALGPQQATDFINRHHNLIRQLADVNYFLGSERFPVISDEKDQILERKQTYGVAEKPGDYLESFNDFIKRQLNQHTALSVVVNKPKDLTREQLKEIRLLLDSNGFSEATLKTAWRNQTNQDIAASILGYIRRAALGEALVPFQQRVDHAMQRIYTQRMWTPVQRQWLERLAKRLVHEVILDQATLSEAFPTDGGAKRLDKMLGGQLDAVMGDLAQNLWESA